MMRAIRYHQFGEPSQVLSLSEQAIPSTLSDELLIQMRLMPINPSDLLMIRGRYPARVTLPAIPGYEGVGVVIEKGKNVQGISVGDRVLGLRGAWGGSYTKESYASGSWQEIVLAKARDVVLVPDGIDDITAAQLYINPLTAWRMIKYELQLQAGDVLIANAGGSSMGQILAQFCSIFRYHLILVTRSDFYTEVLLKLGAQKVINSSKEPLLETVLSYTSGVGVAAALDSVGGKDGALLAQCVKEGGTMLHYGLLSGKQLPQNLSNCLRLGVQVKNYWLKTWVDRERLDERKRVFNEMIGLILSHKLSLSASAVFDLSEIKKAVQASESSNRTGKVLLKRES